LIEIRSEKPEDGTAIRHVNEAAFGGSSEARLVEMLRQADKARIELVAVLDGQLVGHILFSPVTIADARHDFRALGLAPLAVLPSFQRLGIGSGLVRQGLLECKRNGYQVVVVLGNPRYYSRFGFLRASGHWLDNEYNEDDAFMVIELQDGALQEVRGLVKYAPEFHAAGC
jgi:putative acetyltransferase